MHNLACVFGSLESVAAKFKEFYELLSYESVEGNTFRAIFRQPRGSLSARKQLELLHGHRTLAKC